MSTGYMRDVNSQALINIDDADYRRFIAERQQHKQEKQIQQQIASIFDELKDIRRELAELRGKN